MIATGMTLFGLIVADKLLYQVAEFLTLGVFPNRVNADSVRLSQLSRAVIDGSANRDHTERSACVGVARAGESDLGWGGGTPAFGDCIGHGKPLANGGGRMEWDDPSDTTRLGSSL